MESSETYEGKTSRRSHRKSRLGCNNCKARRIKVGHLYRAIESKGSPYLQCDETKPRCVNCARHSVECTYSQVPAHLSRSTSRKRNAVPDSGSRSRPGTEFSFISSSQSDFTIPKRASHKEIDLSSPSPSLSDANSAVAQRPFEFTITDMTLLHHLLSAEELKPHIPDQLIRLGFSVHYLLRLLLALSAFHLSRTASSNQFLGPQIDFSVEAERHLSIAIAGVAATDPQLHQGNSHALYISSLFIFICSLARGPQLGEFLTFRNDTDTPCLSLFHGIRLILEASNTLGISRGFSELHPGEGQDHSVEQEAEKHHNQGNPLLMVHDPQQNNTLCEFREPLQQLRYLVFNKFPNDNPRHSSYCYAFEMLCSRYESILGAGLSGVDLWPEIFGWLYTLPDLFVQDMRDKSHIALLLFSYFLVLLNELDSVWFIQQWPRHIANGVHQNLDEYHRRFAHWPLRQLGLL
ncbi:Zn(II)2Cys6 transcription factor [Penicillium sp. CMV-2018d]|nr:Zn(II)2Cys6 transcription factor [Penicillium sp. CMV-2018d]